MEQRAYWDSVSEKKEFTTAFLLNKKRRTDEYS